MIHFFYFFNLQQKTETDYKQEAIDVIEGLVEVEDSTEKDEDNISDTALIYNVSETPPIHLSILFGFQVYIY